MRQLRSTLTARMDGCGAWRAPCWVFGSPTERQTWAATRTGKQTDPYPGRKEEKVRDSTQRRAGQRGNCVRCAIKVMQLYHIKCIAPITTLFVPGLGYGTLYRPASRPVTVECHSTLHSALPVMTAEIVDGSFGRKLLKLSAASRPSCLIKSWQHRELTVC